MDCRDIIKILTLWDKALIILLSAFAILSFYIVKVLFREGAEAFINIEGSEIGRYTLSQDRVIKISGPLGPSEIGIRNGRIRVLSAPCRDKICIKQGWVSRPGEALICLPNRVMVYIKGEASYDAISW